MSELDSDQLKALAGHFQQKFLSAEADVAILTNEINKLQAKIKELEDVVQGETAAKKVAVTDEAD